MITNQIFLEILKAVCLSVDWVPKLIQKFFPTMEQKFVQRCETEIVADACNDSYGTKFVDRIATQSMSKICNLWRLIVVDCDYAESYRRFLSGGNADASHTVYIVPDDSLYSGLALIFGIRSKSLTVDE